MAALYETEVNALLDVADRGYKCLYDLGAGKGHWEEVRSTPLAALCIAQRVGLESAWLQEIGRWLVSRQANEKSQEVYGSWGEEVWDTAMAVLALLQLRQSDKALRPALEWMGRVFEQSGRGNWHNEPWETCWALIAILESTERPQNVRIESAVEWLIRLQSAETGEIIGPHYTAYLLRIAQLCETQPLLKETWSSLSDARVKATRFLVDLLRDSSPETLWTNEAWSNGQILWFLAKGGLFPIEDGGLLHKALNWFRTRQSKESGGWADVEDTASAILGLLELVRQIITHRSRQLHHPEQFPEKEFQDLLEKKVAPPPNLQRLRWLEHHDDGCISIHIGRRAQKILAIAGSAIALLAALVTLGSMFF